MQKRSRKYFFIVLFLIWALPLQKSPDIRTVTRVIDGDTIHVNTDHGEDEKIRLIGIDSPEMYIEDQDPQPYAREARKYLSDLVLHKRIRMHYDVDRYDKYGRTLAYIYLEDGTFVNAKMIEAGLARTITIAPNVEHSWYLSELQRKARKERVGMWGNND